MEEMEYPIRINKYLAKKKIASRREADQMIIDGVVTINRKRAKLGDQVKEDDVVEVHGARKAYIYIAYYKPVGIVTHSPQYDEQDIQQALGRSDIFPIGRLDKLSEGLIILTDDGRITNAILDSKNKLEKEYRVNVDKPLKKNIERKIAEGIIIEGYKTKPAKAKVLGETLISIILTEGKRHQIRRMLAALGYSVKSLKRVRIGTLKLKNLKPGETRELKDTELASFLKAIDLA